MLTSKNLIDFLHSLEWHDGVIYSVIIERDLVKLECGLYPSINTKERKKYQFNFSNIHSISINIDMNEFKKNERAGHINDQRLYVSKNKIVFRLFILDGYLEIVSKNMTINENCSD